MANDHPRTSSPIPVRLLHLQRRALRLPLTFLRTIRTGLRVRHQNSLMTTEELHTLRKRWGSQEGAADPTFLLKAMELAMENRGGILLECGSGLSTVLIAKAIGDQASLVSLEDNKLWAWRTKLCAYVAGVSNIHLHICGLKRYIDGTLWYDIHPIRNHLGLISLVICDGPATSWHPLARYGLMPVLRDYMIRGAIVLLDDAHRTGEMQVIKMWKTLLDLETVEHFIQNGSGYALLKVRH